MARAVAPVPNPDGSVPLLAGHNQNVGGRKQQEDRCYCVPDLNPLGRKRHPDLDETRRALFCVFDGFGGDQVRRRAPDCLRCTPTDRALVRSRPSGSKTTFTST